MIAVKLFPVVHGEKRRYYVILIVLLTLFSTAPHLAMHVHLAALSCAWLSPMYEQTALTVPHVMGAPTSECTICERVLGAKQNVRYPQRAVKSRQVTASDAIVVTARCSMFINLHNSDMQPLTLPR